MAQALGPKIAASAPKVTSDDVERFIKEHPDIFAQRKIFDVDQILLAGPITRRPATQVMTRQRTREAVERQIRELYGKARPAIRYHTPAFQPAATQAHVSK